MKTSHKISATLIVAALLVAMLVAVSLWAYKQIVDTSAARKQTYELIIRADALLYDLINAETGQRGYTLTGDEAFLAPYVAVRDSIEGQLRDLRALSKSSATLEHLDALPALINEKLTEMSLVIDLTRRHNMAAIRVVVASAQGKRLMDSIRAELGTYLQGQERELAQYETTFQSNMRFLFVLLIAGSLLTLLFALSFAYLVYRETQHNLDNLVHLKTKNLLEIQEVTNQELQLAYATLQVSEEKLSVTLQSIGDAVIATDADGRVKLMNPLAERLSGWTQAEALDRPVNDIFHIISQETRKPSIVPVKETLEQGTIHGLANHTILIARDGSECAIADSCAPIRERGGQVVGAVLIFRDVTVEYAIQQALQQSNVDLANARTVADKANLAKSDFLSSMSHELRTPLNAVLGFAQLLESGTPQPTPSQKSSLDQILKAGWYLLELINEILDLARIESGRLTISSEPVSLNQVMLECHAMIEPQAQKRDLAMTFPHFDEPVFVLADRTRLKQVLINLLFNAIKYNKPDGAVVVEWAMPRAGAIRISITDTGQGLPPEQLEQLFQPFNRLGKEIGIEEGTGIGLTVAKRLVELMEGSIGVESTVGTGTMFWIELQLCDPPQLTHGDTDASAHFPQSDHAGATQRTLLYIEDNPANLRLVEELIARRPDLRLLSAADGPLGIALAREFLPDLILMDINLPGINGIEAMKLLRTDPATAHIPVVAISANVMPSDIRKGLDAGFFRYLTKPIVVREFMDSIRVALEFAAKRAADKLKKESLQ